MGFDDRFVCLFAHFLSFIHYTILFTYYVQCINHTTVSVVRLLHMGNDRMQMENKDEVLLEVGRGHIQLNLESERATEMCADF